MSLTDTQIRKARAADKPVKLPDGGGQQLHLMPTGAKLWRWACRLDGRQKLMALGAYPETTLAEARQQHAAVRRLLAQVELRAAMSHREGAPQEITILATRRIKTTPAALAAEARRRSAHP